MILHVSYGSIISTVDAFEQVIVSLDSINEKDTGIVIVHCTCNSTFQPKSITLNQLHQNSVSENVIPCLVC